MIEGRERHHRLARRIESVLDEFWRDETATEPQITSAQTPECIVVQAEGYETESYIVTITPTNRRLSWPKQD